MNLVEILYLCREKQNPMTINESYENAINLLQKLIAIPSFSKEEKEAADFFQMYIESRGYTTMRKGNNIWTIAAGFDSNKKTLLLNSHIDSVRPSNSWKHEPFKASIEGEKLYGLGSNDAGASLVSLLEVFFMLSEKEQPYNLIFSCSAEEEISGANGCASMMLEMPPIDLAVVGEPTGMQLAVAEKGLLVLDCTARGKSGHAARNEGENAIYKAIEDINWFRNYQFEKKSELLGAVNMNVTMINAGTQHNVVPDKCEFVVDIRTNEFYSNLEVVEEIKKHVSCEVKPRSTHLNSSCISLEHPIVKRGLELGLTYYGSPTSSDQMRIPYTSIKIGPGESSRSHTTDEFILLPEIKQGIDIYIKLLNGLVL
jgi:acetylornithine deacetylase